MTETTSLLPGCTAMLASLAAPDAQVSWAVPIGWTLVHFFWQGALLAAGAAVALVGLRRARPGVRYRVASTFLALMALAPVATFGLLLGERGSAERPIAEAEPGSARAALPAAGHEQPGGGAPARAGDEGGNGRPGAFAGSGATSESGPAAWISSVREAIVGFVERSLGALIAIWAVGVLLLALRLVCAWGWLRAVAGQASQRVPAAWRAACADLSRRVGLRRAVEMRASDAIETPGVLGWLRPVILLPAAAVHGLSLRQVEAILAHELAHIQRNDYLANALQTVVEVVLFYHPVVWWLSGRVRQERENCCDDRAVEACGDRVVYAQALVELEARRIALPQPAVAARGGDLLARVRRLLDVRPGQGRATRVATAGGLALLLSLVTVVTLTALLANPRPAAAVQEQPPAETSKQRDWAQEIRSLEGKNWRESFALAGELASVPADEGYAILKQNWATIPGVTHRQQFLKAFFFTSSFPLEARGYPRLVEVLDLGMRDPSPDVQKWAIDYLKQVTIRDFAEDFSAYEKWFAASKNKPAEALLDEGLRDLTMEAPAAMDEGGAKLRRLTRLLQAATRNGESLRGARNGKAVEQLLPVLEKWTDDVLKTPTDRDRVEAARAAMTVLGALAIDRAYVERVIVAKTKRGVPAEVRLAAIRSLGREANGWVVPQLEELLKDALRDADEYQQLTWPIATALADIGDPAAIPTMIAAIDADNTYQTVYGIGWFGLNRLTGVDYDESHNGQWWRDWWQKNRNRYPEAVRTLEIPALTKTDLKATAAAEQDPTADVRDVANEPITIGGDPKQQYFLIGADQAAKQAAAKGDGLKLLLVLPGGDGSAGFNPFVRRIRKFGLSDGWAIAELVAPKWDETRSKQVVWPTEKNRFAAAKFTTEEFIDAVIKDVRARVRIDARNIYLMGWSSGGPAVYAAMLRKDTSIAGAYVLMSVFPEEFKPVIEHAKGKRFYLFQSPNDQVTPIEHARRAREALEKAGATVMLNTYDGGHGFNFPVWEEIPKAVEWLTGR